MSKSKPIPQPAKKTSWKSVIVYAIICVAILGCTGFALDKLTMGKVTDWNGNSFGSCDNLTDSFCDINIKLTKVLLESKVYNISTSPALLFDILDQNHNKITYNDLTVNGKDVYFILRVYRSIDQQFKWSLFASHHTIDPLIGGTTADSFFTKLTNVVTEPTYGIADFQITNYKGLVSRLNDTSLKYSMTEPIGTSRTNDCSYFILKNFTEDVTIYLTNKTVVCGLGKNGTDCNTTYKQIPVTKQVTHADYAPLIGETLASDGVYNMRVVCNWKAHTGDNARDWKPILSVGNTSLTMTNWTWWNTSWGYKENINITTSGENIAQLNMPVKLYLSSADLGANFNWTYNNSIRFLNSSENGQFTFFIEDWNSTAKNATVWVNVSYLANGTTPIWIYYDKTHTFSPASNGTNTFLYFDDFENPNDKADKPWTIASGCVGSICDVSTSDPYQGLRSFTFMENGADNEIYSPVTFNSSEFYRIRMKMNMSLNGTGTYPFVTLCFGKATEHSQVGWFAGGGLAPTGDFAYRDGWHGLGVAVPKGQWFTWEMADIDLTGSGTIAYVMYSNEKTVGIISAGSNPGIAANNQLYFYTSEYMGNVSVDNLFVAKDMKSTISTVFGSEEAQPSAPSFYVTTNKPEDRNRTNAVYPNFNFTVIGSEATYDCSIYVDGIVQANNGTTLNNTLTSLTAVTNPLSFGWHGWNATCTSGSTANSSANRYIQIGAYMFVAQFGNMSNWTNTTINWNQFVRVFNNNSATVYNITVQFGTNFSCQNNTISSIASMASSLVNCSQQFTRPNVTIGNIDDTIQVAAINLDNGAYGSSDPMTLINPLDPPDLFATKGANPCVFYSNGLLKCNLCANITSNQNLNGLLFNATGSGVTYISARVYNFSELKKNDSCTLIIFPGGQIG